MALVVLLRGVNVGGHRTFRPTLLAKELSRYDVVNVGAAGTFVVRKPGPVEQFRAEMGLPGRAMTAASRVVEPVALNPGKAFLAAGLAGGVIVGGLYLGREIRRRVRNSRLPYRSYTPSRKSGDEGDYAMGI